MTYLRLISSFLLLLTFIHCSDRNEEVRIINGTFIYINETEDSVYVAGNCGFTQENYNGTLIPPSDTVILYIKNALVDGGDISINDEYVFYGGQSCKAIYGDSLNCFKYPSDFRFMKNYENKKQLSKNNLELTYRFTEATKAAEINCK